MDRPDDCKSVVSNNLRSSEKQTKKGVAIGLRPFFSSGESGFTLIELILVIALIGIVAAVGSVRYFKGLDFEQRGAADDVANALRYAQKLAVGSGCDVQVTIDNVARSYTLNQRNNLANCVDTGSAFGRTVFNPGRMSDAYSNSFTADVGLSTTLSPIVFDARGEASGNATISVGGRSYQVIAATGLVNEI